MATLQVTALSFGWSASRRPPLPQPYAHYTGTAWTSTRTSCLAALWVDFALLECYDQRLGLEYTPISTHAIRYSFPNDTVELNVDVQTGIIYKISALTNYKGTLLGSIHVGDSIPDVLQNDPSFIYDDFEMAYFSEGSPGVALEPDVHDPWPEDFPYLRIGAITIFDAEYVRNARKLTLDYTC